MGLWNPVLFALGYVWADIVNPNRIVPYALGWISLPMVFGILTLLFLPKAVASSGPRWNTTSTLLLLHGIWLTLSLNWAVYQDAAWFSWEYAVKAIAFGLILPWFLSSRFNIEAMIWTLVLSVGLLAAPYGLKFILGGGGYRQSLGLITGNSNYAESSTLAVLSVSVMPLIWFLMRHQTVFQNRTLVRFVAIAGIFLMALSTAGTYARTGLVCLAVLICLLVLQRGEKAFKAALGVLVGIGFYIVAPDRWVERMLSIDDATDYSSMGRLAVWKWTLEYVTDHPFGGGPGIWQSSQYTLTLVDGSELEIRAKAFHSIYFEVLGSLGYPGLVIYLSLIASMLLVLRNVVRNQCYEERNAWGPDLARSLILSILIFLTGGLFIGVAFQSYLPYLAALSIGLAGIVNNSGRRDASSKA